MKNPEKQQSRVIGIRRAAGRGARLLCGGAAALILLSLPLDWGRLGKDAALTAAGLLRPDNAAEVLLSRLTREESAVSVAAAPKQDAPDSTTAHSVSDSTAVTAAAPETVPMTAVTSSGTSRNTAPPGEDGTGGKIYPQKVPSGDKSAYGIAVRNRSSISPDIPAALSATLTQKFDKTDEAQVLIIHTHTTERYMPYEAGYYNAADRVRTKDGSVSVCAVGEAVVQALAQAGITAVHDTTVHDSPKYSGAYSRSEQTVKTALAKYPHIKVVLDLHRDAIMQGNTGLVRPTVTVDGKPAAQMMIITNVVSTKALPNPHWQQNLALAAQWQKALTAVNPDLMRPLSTVSSRYNQHLSAGYLLVEVGSEGNTVDDAVYSGQILGKTLASLLTA